MPALPPVARVDEGPDPYAWLRTDSDAARAHLEAENQHFAEHLAGLEPLINQLQAELQGRETHEGRQTLATPHGPWLYYQRLEGDDQYPREYRAPWAEGLSLEPDLAQAQLLLDPNPLNDGGPVDVRSTAPSPDHRYFAYSLDTTGSERYRLFIKDLASGTTHAVPGPDGFGAMAWANDNQTLWFLSIAEGTWRPSGVHRYRLGEDAAHSVYEEADEGYVVGRIQRSASEQFVIFTVASPAATECWALAANTPACPAHCLQPRQANVEYEADHGELDGAPAWLMRSNAQAESFAVYQQPALPGCWPSGEWVIRVPERPGVVITELHLRQNGYLLGVRDQGLAQLEVYQSALPVRRMPASDASYRLLSGEPLPAASNPLRYTYESFAVAPQTWEFNLLSGDTALLRDRAPAGGFDPASYLTERLQAQASDGTAIPLSVVRGRDAAQPAPLLMLGYGAYNIPQDPAFNSAYLSLLERGFSLAIAHVRGGGALGKAWHAAGSLANKENTFGDFIACAEHLIAQGYTTPAQLVIEGRSAGGTLIGTVLNRRPELFAGALADVPFVDVLNTMLDPSLPLTIPDYGEWGNPEAPEVHARIAAYAPYENVRAQAYPALWVTAGWNDSRVPYWEPAKWVAKLRAHNTGSAALVFHTDLGGGHTEHGGYSAQQRREAERLAFILQAAGLAG
ncbi:prolyl oligopeptidase family serine peptidase [Pseudomonas sp. NPDC007930]|uniref:prolyl oligopeptidase family serine peptidase n=1 Tax=Pseudomonas sp. NPDC007930 TaxID=3364417 RepID=UPI0036ED5B40